MRYNHISVEKKILSMIPVILIVSLGKWGWGAQYSSHFLDKLKTMKIKTLAIGSFIIQKIFITYYIPGTVLGLWDVSEQMKQNRNINITNKPNI